MKTGYRFGATVISLLCSIVCLVLALIPITITQARAGGDRTAMLRAPVYPIAPSIQSQRNIACTMEAQGECEGTRRACERKIVAPNIRAKQEACMNAEQRCRQRAGCGADPGAAPTRPPAGAQDFASQSCGQLWHARNAVFAEFGYCFKTPQAISAFGRGCFPPFGKLPASAQARVDNIISWERRKGCSG